MPSIGNYTVLLFGMFAGFLLLFLLLAYWRPYRLSNSFILLFCLIVLVIAVVSLFAEDAAMILWISTLVIVVSLFLVPVLLIWNGVVILKKESGKFANFLPLLLGIMIAAGEIAFALFLLRDSFSGLSFLQKPVLLFIGASVFYCSSLLLAFVLYMLVLPHLSRVRAFDTVIVHGCALIHGDQVSRILGRRLDLALKLYRKSEERSLIVVSGGRGNDETVSEASAMRAYLMEKGVPKEQILMEDQSHSTRENLSFSDQLLLERGGGGKIALVTSGYHVFRCVWIAKKLSFHCRGFGAPVAAYYWPSAVIREFIAVYSRKRYLLTAIAFYFLIVILPVFLFFFHGF